MVWIKCSDSLPIGDFLVVKRFNGKESITEAFILRVAARYNPELYEWKYF